MNSRYQFRFFLDPGSGTCLWAADKRTLQEFGYAVDLELLQVSIQLRQRLRGLVVRYDESMDWDDPGAGVRWNSLECDEFNREVRQVMMALEEELSHSCNFVNEFAGIRSKTRGS